MGMAYVKVYQNRSLQQNYKVYSIDLHSIDTNLVFIFHNEFLCATENAQDLMNVFDEIQCHKDNKKQNIEQNDEMLY